MLLYRLQLPFLKGFEANRMSSTTVVNEMPDCIRNLLICSLIELDPIDQESLVCHHLFFKYQTQSGFHLPP